MKLNRRGFGQVLGVGGLSLCGQSWLSNLASAAGVVKQESPFRSCIMLWMSGGPSQIDTLDLKVGHRNGGPSKEIATTVPGVRISEHLPRVASMMDEICLVRSMSTKEGDHERATRLVRTGYTPAGPVNYPSFGAVVSKELGGEVDLPSFVSVAPGYFLTAGGSGAGFLGADYSPLVVQSNAAGEGELPKMQVNNLTRHKPKMNKRLRLFEDLEAGFQATHRDEIIVSHATAYRRAVEMMKGRANAVFDLENERKSVREEYGSSSFAQGCLLARRLVETGVPFVEVSLNNVEGNGQFGWDTHSNNFEGVKALSQVLDQGWGTLLRDLKRRGLLDSTLVLWMGEFGRTPRINGGQGRDHFPNAWSMAMAGGGVAGGQVYGKTSGDGMEVTENLVTIPDMLSTVCKLVGIDADRQNMSNVGRPIRVVNPEAEVINEIIS
jgi:hypothetical protein